MTSNSSEKVCVAEDKLSFSNNVAVAELEQRIRDLPRGMACSSRQPVQEAEGASPISNNSFAGTPKSPSHRFPNVRRRSCELIPDASILIDLEAHARSISSNIDMVLRDLRGSLRGMSDLTLESSQVFSFSVGSACDAVDTAIKATYTMLAKAEELNSSMEGVHKLAQQVKDIKRLLDLFETHFSACESSSGPTTAASSPAAVRN